MSSILCNSDRQIIQDISGSLGGIDEALPGKELSAPRTEKTTRTGCRSINLGGRGCISGEQGVRHSSVSGWRWSRPLFTTRLLQQPFPGNVRRYSNLCKGTSPATVFVGLGAVQPVPLAGGSTKVTSSSIIERSNACGDGTRRLKTARSAGDLACAIWQLSCHCLIMSLLTTCRDL